jgi:hypothetical protein
MTYLYAGLTVTWVIHIAYLLYLTSRFSRLREEAKELERER